MDIIRYSYPQKYKDKGLSSLFLHLMKQYVKKKTQPFHGAFQNYHAMQAILSLFEYRPCDMTITSTEFWTQDNKYH